MNKYFVTLHLEKHFQLPADTKTLEPEIQQFLIDNMKAGNVALRDYVKWHGYEIDNQAEELQPIIKNETVFEVALEIDEKAVDWHDGGESLYYYVLEKLVNQKQHHSVIQQYTEGNYTKTDVMIYMVEPM